MRLYTEVIPIGVSLMAGLGLSFLRGKPGAGRWAGIVLFGSFALLLSLVNWQWTQGEQPNTADAARNLAPFTAALFAAVAAALTYLGVRIGQKNLPPSFKNQSSLI